MIKLCLSGQIECISWLIHSRSPSQKIDRSFIIETLKYISLLWPWKDQSQKNGILWEKFIKLWKSQFLKIFAPHYPELLKNDLKMYATQFITKCIYGNRTPFFTYFLQKTQRIQKTTPNLVSQPYRFYQDLATLNRSASKPIIQSVHFHNKRDKTLVWCKNERKKIRKQRNTPEFRLKRNLLPDHWKILKDLKPFSIKKMFHLFALCFHAICLLF